MTDGLTKDVAQGFLDALLFPSEWAGEGYEFSEAAKHTVTVFVREHLERISGINWQKHVDARRLGHCLYFLSAGFGRGYWNGTWGEVGDALDEMTQRHAWDVYINTKGVIELV